MRDVGDLGDPRRLRVAPLKEQNPGFRRGQSPSATADLPVSRGEQLAKLEYHKMPAAQVFFRPFPARGLGARLCQKG